MAVYMPAPKFTPHPLSAPGDFYVENGMCITCGVPHAVAPDLMAWVDGETSHCIWKKQPETLKELDQAIAVLDAQELGCHRYAGDDPAILKRISPEFCDYPSQSPSAFQRKQMLSNLVISLSPFAATEGFLARIWRRLTHKNKEQE
jgi:hypothetical protein